MSDSVRPQRRQPTRLPRTRDSPGKNAGVGCHFTVQCMKVKSESEVAQSCQTLATPWTAAYQAPPSMGFSRQKYWSGVPLPSPHQSWGLLQCCALGTSPRCSFGPDNRSQGSRHLSKRVWNDTQPHCHRTWDSVWSRSTGHRFRACSAPGKLCDDGLVS